MDKQLGISIKNKKMEISKLVTAENNVAVTQILLIAKQDIALDVAIRALNELSHIHRVEFESYGEKFGIDVELLVEIKNLKDKLQKAKHGRY